MSVRFADQWAATVGARYYEYDEDRVLTFAGGFGCVGCAGSPRFISARVAYSRTRRARSA